MPVGKWLTQTHHTHLFWGAENMGVVLLEPANPREPSESARHLVAMENSEIGHSEG